MKRIIILILILLTAVTTFHNAYFDRGTGPTLLDDLTCTATESRLVDCRHDGIGQYDRCSHADDAGVRCRERESINATVTHLVYQVCIASKS